jgi:hypothetical protein
MSSESPQYQVRALERALDLLDSFSLTEPELSFTELTERTAPMSWAVSTSNRWRSNPLPTPS